MSLNYSSEITQNKIPTTYPTLNEYLNKIDQCMVANMPANMLQLAKEALTYYPNAGSLHAAVAYFYIEERRYGLARKNLDRALALSPLDEAVLLTDAHWWSSPRKYLTWRQKKRKRIAEQKLKRLLQRTLSLKVCYAFFNFYSVQYQLSNKILSRHKRKNLAKKTEDVLSLISTE